MRAKVFDAYAVYILPYPSWKQAHSLHLKRSSNQQNAWLRLMVTALETNFFFFESTARAPCLPVSRLASRNNRFQALLTASRRIYSTSNQSDVSAQGTMAGTQNSLNGMVLPSINEAFRGGDGTSLTYIPRYDGDGLSIGGMGGMNYNSGVYSYDTNQQYPRGMVNVMGQNMGDWTRSVFYNEDEEISKEDLRHLLITRPVCRLYYESDHKFGYYQKYKYMLHKNVGATHANKGQVIAEFIPVSPQMLMNRIVSYELCCKGSWTILFNMFLNHSHSSIVRLCCFRHA